MIGRSNASSSSLTFPYILIGEFLNGVNLDGLMAICNILLW
jgi:hypothetical protein